MTCNLINKRGVPALACPVSDVASQWSCSLVVKHSEARMQATLSLQSSVPTHGFDSDQVFILVYEADNLMPGITRLEHTIIPIPQPRQREIARQGSPNLKMLTLKLKKPCAVWCPHSSGSITPKYGFESPFHQLAKLAQATEIHVLFDYNWLHRDKRARFERFVSHPEELTAFTIDNYANRFRQTDWSVFSPTEDVSSEPPPSYVESSKRDYREGVANKRQRQTASNSILEYPHPKRILLSPEPIYAPSSAEKATAVSTPSPKPLYATIGQPPGYAPSPTEKATTVATPSPRPLRSPIAYVPVAYTPDYQDAIKNAVEAALPGLLQSLIPEMLPRLLAAPSSSQSPSPSPSRIRRLHSSQRSSPNPNSTAMTSLRALISARAAAHAEAQLQRIYDDTLDHATELRNTADVNFHELLDEQKFDVTTVKDDSVVELNRLFDEKVEEFKDSTAEILEAVEERAEMVFVNACDRLDALVGRERACLKRERESLEADKRRFEEERQIPRPDVARVGGRRAMSLPL